MRVIIARATRAKNNNRPPASKKWVMRNNESTLPGLMYESTDKIGFVSLQQCVANRPVARMLLITTPALLAHIRSWKVGAVPTH